MASSLTAEHDIFECQVCMEEMLTKQPRLLHCGHSFCTPCLQKIWKNSTIKCPTCRKDTPANQITDLGVNFNLAKIKQYEQTLTKKTENDDMCKFCLKKGTTVKAVIYCEDCDRKMCEMCGKHHDRLPAFKDHKTSRIFHGILCEKHSLEVQYICTKCTQGLCLECTFDSQHAEHAERIENMDTGLQHIKDKMKLVRNEATKTIENVVVASDYASMSNTIKVKIRQKVKEIETQLHKEEEELLKLLPDENFHENTNNAMKSLTDLQDKIDSLMIVGDNEFMKGFYGVFKEAREMLSVGQQYKALAKRKISFTEAGTNQCLIGELQIKGDTKPRLLLDLKCHLFNITSPSEIELSDDCFYLSDHKLNYVLKFSFDGVLIGKYEADIGAFGAVNAIKIYQGNLYIGQDRAITVVHNGGRTTYKPKVDAIGCFEILDSRTILIAGLKSVVRFDLKKGTCTLVTWINGPDFMSHSNGFCCISESGTQTVKIFNEVWKNIGGVAGTRQFTPKGVTFLSNGNLLIAMNTGSAILEYKKTGEFVRLWLDQKNGILYPRALKYHKGRLLMTEKHSGQPHIGIKLFVLC